MITVELGRNPAPPLSLNRERCMHWSDRRKLLDPWKATAWACALSSNLPAAIDRTPCIVTLTIPFTTRHRRDPHNYVPVVKAVVDGLVKAGVWPDDTHEWVTVHEPTLLYDPTGDVPASITLTARDAA